MPPENYNNPHTTLRPTMGDSQRLSILEARLKEIRAFQAFKEKYPNATLGECEAFKLGYKTAFE